jgi:hypothetical protein
VKIQRSSPAVIFQFVLIVTIIGAALLFASRWYSAPCSQFKTDPLLRNGYAPARCLP